MGEHCCGHGNGQGHGKEDECRCNANHPSIEDVAFSAHYKIDALIGLLIKKGNFTEEELQKEIEALYAKLEEQHNPESAEEQEKDESKQDAEKDGASQ